MNDEINLLADEHARAFKQISELEGVVIRGQVMVEMALNRAIRGCTTFPEEYKSDKFSFSQIVIMGHMLGICTAFKAELNALNKLRNQIAHGTEFDEKFIKVIVTEIRKKDPNCLEKGKTPVQLLSKSISFICGAIAIAPQFADVRVLINRLNKRAEQSEAVQIEKNSPVKDNSTK